METKGREYKPIFIPSQFWRKLARCSLFPLSFQQTKKDYIPILSCNSIGVTWLLFEQWNMNRSSVYYLGACP